MSAICSISTRPLAFRVGRSATRSTMRRQRPRLGASSIAPDELDAFGLDAARGEMPARDLGIFGGDAHMAPAPRIVAARHLGRLGDREPALADAEIDRRVDLRIVELHQHVGAGDAEMRRAEGHEGRDVEAADADDVEVRDGWS